MKIPFATRAAAAEFQWDQAAADLRINAQSHPSSAAEFLEALNDFLASGGDMRTLRLMTAATSAGMLKEES